MRTMASKNNIAHKFDVTHENFLMDHEKYDYVIKTVQPCLGSTGNLTDSDTDAVFKIIFTYRLENLFKMNIVSNHNFQTFCKE